MKKLKVSVLIPTKNRAGSLKKALDSLSKQRLKSFEVVVIDGGSTDNTEVLVKSYAKKFPVKFAVQSGGLIPQMNKAWKLAKGEIVVRSDDDVVVDRGWLQAIVETFDSDSQIGGVTGPTIIPLKHKKSRDLFFFQTKLKKGNIFWRLLGKIYYGYFMEGEPMRVSHWFKSGAFSLGNNYKSSLKIKKNFEVNNLEACNWSVRRRLLEEISGFDPTFVGIGEYHEPDASFRIMKLGYKLVFNPKAIVSHQPSLVGFFKDRPASYGRAQNFINFYFRHIKPDTLDKALRFTAYLLFLNLFWGYKFFQTKKIDQLGCFLATPVTLVKNILVRNKS